ncbi:alpha/beta fold hydrolase [Limnoraphis robusta Tam1]|uniref:YheT family hydrolase n=1 Tax=Limnoraphis robusta TaxID=1118279 RepID=UPI002B20B5D2|nr:alpha/beta fold hydrolase [Limnoraphis robusta]MEA5541165.1 alpha/beta fold hydrolase [Limnoraphis robusta Tam1]
MDQLVYTPPFLLKNGLTMTVYAALRAKKTWEQTTPHPEPPYQDQIFIGAGNVPIFGKYAIPERSRGTIVGTYGITGDLDNQWFLRLLGRKAYAQGYSVVLFDWRAHGKTAELSPTLTSDGLYEGEDFVRIAAHAKALGCPPPFWFTGYSLGGQLALWGVKAAQTVSDWGNDLEFSESDFAGGAVICPSLDSTRSLSYLVQHPWGKYLERAIASELKKLARRIYTAHPEAIDPEAIKRANSIWGFDHELVIERLGFSSVEDYYNASSALALLPQLQKPTLILYAADDPLFDPTIIPDLQAASRENSAIDLRLTQYGGHVGYISSKSSQLQAEDPDRWWAWNRMLQWCDRLSNSSYSVEFESPLTNIISRHEHH